MSYLKYDDIGLLEVYCMCCGTVIKKRDVWNGAMVYKNLSNFRIKVIDITEDERPSNIHAMVCAQCVDDIDDVKAQEICGKAMVARKDRLEKLGFEKSFIDEHMKKFNLKIDKQKEK